MRALVFVVVGGLAACGSAASQSPAQAPVTTQAPVCCNAQGGVGTTPYGPVYSVKP